MRHTFPSKPPPFSVFGNEFISIHGNIDCLLNFIGHYSPHERTTWVATGRIVDEVPSRDGGHIRQLLVVNFLKGGGEYIAIVVGVGLHR